MLNAVTTKVWLFAGELMSALIAIPPFAPGRSDQSVARAFFSWETQPRHSATSRRTHLLGIRQRGGSDSRVL